MNSFFRELKQRKVYRVALGYTMVAWLVGQVSATIMAADQAPEWILPFFITAVVLGFPVAFVLDALLAKASSPEDGLTR
jgi:hypothetical protein